MHSNSRIFSFVPNLPDTAKNMYGRFTKTLTEVPCGSIHNTIELMLDSNELSSLPEQDRLSTQLFFEVLQDIIRQGWTLLYEDGFLRAVPPEMHYLKSTDRDDIKERLRRSLVEARNEQLNEESVRKFITYMEKERTYAGKTVSVLNLFLSPEKLIQDLTTCLNAPQEAQDALLQGSIQPYLQLADTSRDPFTNLRLRDIWRYARYTWSLPYSAQPGRQMQYLIRDASRDCHPIIGIGALGNSVVQITCRDQEIGWSIDTVVRKPDGYRYISSFIEELERSVSDIYWQDLISSSEVQNPTQDTLTHLLNIAAEIPSINKEGEKRSDESVGNAVFSPAYKRKRALALYDVLRAKFIFRLGKSNTTSDKDLFEWLKSKDDGRRAMGTAVRNIKKRHVGSSMMDITTCGAIPPYTDILGGKLVSLLMASPQVVHDYKQRYQNAVSEIASRMKGQNVTRPANLVLLNTTSLYHVGSSQYNRINVPVVNGFIKYHFVGKTLGFGSVHLSQRTYRTIQRLLRIHSELNPQSSAFAAGVNFKMRTIKNGLRHIGLSQLIQHENPRLVYMVPLSTNWREYLTGIETEPQSIYKDLENPSKETELLINYWKHRWFIPRVKSGMGLLKMKGKGRVKLSDLFLYDGAEF
ncbi:Druantia anti-phage system protein DruA [Alicyclobacillus mengziensis]|uniref:DUF4338 domain-containing protein n=1 Tax=Alicyclobacillus mengziensis TaxID=2931921 RepID=A0A9X7VXV6_9BACL|nr:MULTISPECIES: Druantia anti-phage system protein DruA [Alicyclobacillus]MCF8568208.1 DUF4338 domain-containing protein [Alicyclobacillus tolerans]QSO46679.1 DUF4338 domain-containing protein [Alicyclobacillus mengziensis]